MPLLALSELQDASPLFRGKAGTAFARLVMKAFSVETVNRISDAAAHLQGSGYTTSVLRDAELSVRVIGREHLEALAGSPFITVSNHPFGGLDGILLIDLVDRLCPDFKVIVNKFLTRIKSLETSFIPVIPTGTVRTAPTAESIQGIRTALRHIREGHPLGIFPSGAVSDLHLTGRTDTPPAGVKGATRRIWDRPWQEPVVRLIEKARVPVVPIRFFDRNSLIFYLLGLIDWRIRVLRLPREIVNKEGRTLTVGIGPAISVEEQRAHAGSIEAFTAFLRDRVYGMTPQI